MGTGFCYSETSKGRCQCWGTTGRCQVLRHSACMTCYVVLRQTAMWRCLMLAVAMMVVLIQCSLCHACTCAGTCSVVWCVCSHAVLFPVHVIPLCVTIIVVLPMVRPGMGRAVRRSGNRRVSTQAVHSPYNKPVQRGNQLELR